MGIIEERIQNNAGVLRHQRRIGHGGPDTVQHGQQTDNTEAAEEDIVDNLEDTSAGSFNHEIKIHTSTSSHQNRLVSEYFLDTPLAMNRRITLTAELKRPTAVE